MTANHPARNLARCLAPRSRSVRATGRQPPTYRRRMTGETTCKITYVTPMSDARRPHWNLARQPTVGSRNGRANGPRKIPQATRKIPTASFQPSQLNIMNTPTTPQPTPDLESLHKAIQEFRPNPHRVPFSSLKPFHDSIIELRAKRASYRSVAELLQQHGVKTSRARVAEYGRIVLEGGKKRKRQKRTKSTPAANAPATLPSAPTVAAQPAPATPPATAITSEVPPPPKESSPYRSRGPHIANVRMMSPEEKADFDAFLKAKNAPKS